MIFCKVFVMEKLIVWFEFLWFKRGKVIFYFRSLIVRERGEGGIFRICFMGWKR